MCHKAKSLHQRQGSGVGSARTSACIARASAIACRSISVASRSVALAFRSASIAPRRSSCSCTCAEMAFSCSSERSGRGFAAAGSPSAGREGVLTPSRSAIRTRQRDAAAAPSADAAEQQEGTGAEEKEAKEGRGHGEQEEEKEEEKEEEEEVVLEEAAPAQTPQKWTAANGESVNTLRRCNFTPDVVCNIASEASEVYDHGSTFEFRHKDGRVMVMADGTVMPLHMHPHRSRIPSIDTSAARLHPTAHSHKQT